MANIMSAAETILCRMFSLLDIEAITDESLDLIPERLTSIGLSREPKCPPRLLLYATTRYGISPF
jgi:hypothetical protein